MDRKSFYLGAFLHDIGKFIERAKDPKRKERAERWIAGGLTDKSYAHRRYGADFIEEYKYIFDEKMDVDVGALNRCVLYHHRGKDLGKSDYKFLDKDEYVKMVRIADSWASREREEDKNLKPQEYLKSKLVNIFSILYDKRKIEYLDIKKLDLSTLIPKESEKEKPITEENRYKDLVDSFLEEFKHVTNETQLFYLLEKYLTYVPAQSPVSIEGRDILYRSDISLFDHSRITAAIAVCIYDEYAKGNIDKDAILSKESEIEDKEIALLIQADFSGIQSFIFNVKSKGAAKNLKGRSYYLQILSDVISAYMLRELELPVFNLLYNGGGNFYILASISKKDKVEKIKKNITRIIAKHHQGDIYVSVGYVPLKGKDFESMEDKWREVSEQTAKGKANKFSEICYNGIFDPYDVYNLDETTGAENNFNDFQKLTKCLRNACSICISPKDVEEKTCYDFPQQKIFEVFGYKVSFDKKNKEWGYVFNDTSFLPDYAGFKFSVVDLPVVEFDEIAKKATGDKKLAYLKMDVDNLGSIFKEGLKGKSCTISRVAVLSRMFKLFFEGYLNVIVKNGFKDETYAVYSGGDDTFLIGAWNRVFELAECINKNFRKFVAENPKVTLSASINIFPPKYPLIRAASIAEETLEKGKTHKLRSEKEPSKNKIVILGEVFKWNEFCFLKDFWCRLYDLIENKGESRALLTKVYNSTRNFNLLLEQSAKNRLNVIKVWRLYYYLRDMRSENKEARERLIETYKKMILNNLMYFDKDGKERGKVSNPMLIPVAVRLAELQTKKVTNESLEEKQ